MWLTWRSIISQHLAAPRPAAPASRSSVQRVADRRERIAQLVRERREELVLAAIGLLALLQVRAHLVLALARAQRACTALTSAVTRTGRSSRVTLPSVRDRARHRRQNRRRGA